mmetsp:Transcript_70683/g.170712  ORF Transcript_70683/g.170712 Transcript_70683/m.170712 type:complete len:184 (-) Transcript_70683:162-713(-)
MGAAAAVGAAAVMRRRAAAAAALGVAARQPAPHHLPSPGSVLGVAVAVISQRAIPPIDEPLAAPSGVAAEGLIEGLRSPPSRSRSGDGCPRALLAFCSAFCLPHSINCFICTAGFLFRSPWSSQPSRQDPTKQRAPHKAPMTKTSSAKANIWIGSSPGGPTGGAGGTGGGSVGVLGGGDGDCV